MDHKLHTTHWSMILQAKQAGTPESARALASLCETYWFPLYAYARRRGYLDSDAQDVTQAFFARLLEKDYIASIDPARGRFRAFLLTAFKHFLSKEREKARAQKRGGGQITLSLDLADGESRYAAVAVESLTPEQVYDRQWAIDLLERVMSRLESEVEPSKGELWFASLKGCLLGDRAGRTHAETAQLLGSTEAAVKMAIHRMKERYGQILREEIGATLEHLADVEDEIGVLFTIFSG